MFLWLAVTPDKYEFPIYIEDSSSKLAEKLGITASTVIVSVSRNKSGINSGRKIVKVELDDT
jgi:hypothetical protein